MPPVVFRVWRESGEVFALFATLAADNTGLVTAYQHVGQHSAANYTACVKRSRPAQPDEYADLLGELLRTDHELRVACRRPRQVA